MFYKCLDDCNNDAVINSENITYINKKAYPVKDSIGEVDEKIYVHFKGGDYLAVSASMDEIIAVLINEIRGEKNGS